MDACVRVAAQLGAGRIIPFVCERSPEWAHEEAACQEILDDLRKSSEASAFDAGFGTPELADAATVAELAPTIALHDAVALCWEEAGEQGASMPDVVRGAGSPLVIVGPVDGLTGREADALIAAGATPVSLGEHVLGVEAASAAAMTLAWHALGGLGA